MPGQREIPGTGGPITIDFGFDAINASTACNDGTDRSSAEVLGVFTFDLDGQQGEWCVERLVFKNDTSDPDYTGSWYNSTDTGWGLTIYTQGKGENQTLVVVIYYYDADGKPRWALGVLNNPDFSSEAVVKMDQFEGYCPTCPVVALTTGDAGTVTLTLVQPSNSLDAGNIADIDVNFLGAPGGSWQRTDQPIQMLSDLPD
jgi:hypothetical protein